MLTNNYKKIVAAIKRRQELESQVQLIAAKYQPRIDKLVAVVAKRTSKKMVKIRTLTTDIRIRRFKLNGREYSQMQRLFPHLNL